MNTVSNHFRGDVRISEDRVHDARVAMSERPHRVKHMHGVAHTGLNRGTRLIVVGIGVSERNYNFRCDGGLNQLHRAGQLGRDRQNSHQTVRGLQKPVQSFDRSFGDRLRGMHAAAGLANKRSLKMDAQNFGCERAILGRLLRIFVAANVARNSLEAAAGLIDWRCNGGGDDRCGPRDVATVDVMRSRAFALASITSWPPAPWMCTSTNPGTTVIPAAT